MGQERKENWAEIIQDKGASNMSHVVRKPAFCICENKDADHTAKLISAFVFARQIIECLFYLNPKFQASSHLL